MYNQLFEILSSVWMIDPAAVRSYLPVFAHFLNGGKMEQPEEPVTYLEEHARDYKSIAKSAGKISVISDDFDSNDLPENAVAVHPIYGVIFSDSGRWWENIFSTKKFVKNLKAADANENIIAHFIPARTPGGQTHYLDIAARTMEELTKPVVTHYEKYMASGGVYITAASTEIYANSKFDRVGSIGTMMSYLDMQGILEKLGAKYVEEYASLSNLKNKLENDLMEGKPEEFIKQVLDPLNEGFLETVKKNRPGVTSAPKDSGVLNGAMFYVEQGIEAGLVDGIMSQAEAINRAYELGLATQITNSII